jgi:hypothetical protein
VSKSELLESECMTIMSGDNSNMETETYSRRDVKREVSLSQRGHTEIKTHSGDCALFKTERYANIDDFASISVKHEPKQEPELETGSELSKLAQWSTKNDEHKPFCRTVCWCSEEKVVGSNAFKIDVDVSDDVQTDTRKDDIKYRPELICEHCNLPTSLPFTCFASNHVTTCKGEDDDQTTAHVEAPCDAISHTSPSSNMLAKSNSVSSGTTESTTTGWHHLFARQEAHVGLCMQHGQGHMTLS